MLVAVGLIAERGERLGDLALRTQTLTDTARDLRAKNGRMRERTSALRAENRTLRAENRSPRGRLGVSRLLRRAYRKVSSLR